MTHADLIERLDNWRGGDDYRAAQLMDEAAAALRASAARVEKLEQVLRAIRAMRCTTKPSTPLPAAWRSNPRKGDEVPQP